MSQLQKEIARRRTFAIISHPDAGKTTLTEKLLLFGGAIQMAGTVKARKAARHATSDWMKLEKERGISVTSSVMQFKYHDRVVNLLDTPGHADFSEDTYRTLTAVDSALMVIDCAKGVEERTIKLMEVCRLRQTPIFTFINKLDREGREPIELLDEVESVQLAAYRPCGDHRRHDDGESGEGVGAGGHHERHAPCFGGVQGHQSGGETVSNQQTERHGQHASRQSHGRGLQPGSLRFYNLPVAAG